MGHGHSHGHSHGTPVAMNKQDEKYAENFKIGEFWAHVGIWGNLFLTIFKYICGVVGHSAAMIADATHSGSDILASAGVLFGFKMSKKPRDKKHPYGHSGADIIATLLVASMLLIAGVTIVTSTIKTIMGGDFHKPGAIALVAAFVAIFTKEIMFRLVVRAGRKINSPALVADAYHHRSDVFASMGAVVGIGGAMLGFEIMDPIAAGVVAFFILQMAYTTFRSAFDQIMRSSCEDDICEEICKHAMDIDGVVATRKLRCQQTGPFITADITLVIDGELSVEQGHVIAAAARANMLEKASHLYDIIVHVEPTEKITEA